MKRELDHWLNNPPRGTSADRPGRFVIVLTAGEIVWRGDDFDWTKTTAIPQTLDCDADRPPATLRGRFTDEPLFVDLRWARGQSPLSLRHPRFLDDVATVSSTIRRLPKSSLIGEDERQHRRYRRARNVAFTTVACLIVLLIAALIVANARRLEDERQATIARSRELAAKALSQIDVDPRESLTLAQAAVRTFDTREAEEALSAALMTSRARLVLRHGEDVFTSVFAPRGTAVVTMTPTRITLWDVETGRQRWSKEAQFSRGSNSSIDVLQFSPGGRFVAAITADGTVRLWDASSGRPVGIGFNSQPVDLVVCSPNDRIVGSSAGGDVEFWHIDSNAKVRLTGTLGSRIAAMQFTHDSKQLVTVYNTGRAAVWELSKGKRSFVRHPPVRDADLFAISRSADRIAAHKEALMYVWPLAPGEVWRIDWPANPQMIVLGPHVFNVATIGLSGDAWVWHATPGGGPILTQVRGHSERINSLSFSPDGEGFVTASIGGSAKVWDNATLQLATDLRGHTGAVASASFSTVGHQIVTASAGGNIFRKSRRLPVQTQYLRITAGRRKDQDQVEVERGQSSPGVFEH